MTRAAYIVDGVRSPFGRYGGGLAGVRADDLAAVVITALVERTKIPADRIDDVILGCANQAGEDNRNVARMAALLAGLPVAVPGVTVNRLCASGLQAIADACRAVSTGEADLVIAGGVEQMTRAPLVMGKAAEAFQRGNPTIYDTTLGWRFINPKMAEGHGTLAMGETAEKVAEKCNVSREAQDRFALTSQQRAGKALASGRMALETVPITTGIDKKTGAVLTFAVDEHPRPDTTPEQLAKLKPAFAKAGTVTAGNASGLNDGAAVVLVASGTSDQGDGPHTEGALRHRRVRGSRAELHGALGPSRRPRSARARRDRPRNAPRARGAQRGVCRPGDPVHRPARDRSGARQRQWRRHRVGPSARGVGRAHAADALAIELHQRSAQYGLASMCIGVGQGAAVIIERT